MPPRPGRPVLVRLPGAVAQESARRAATCGVPLPRWISEVVESHLSELRCRHGERPPEAPAAEVPAE